MLLVPDLGKVAGDLEQHTLMGCHLARPLLSNTFVKIADRRIQGVSDLEQPSSRHTIDPALVFVGLLIGDTDHLGELLLGQAQHDSALANLRSDMVIDRRSRPPSLRLSHTSHPRLSAQTRLWWPLSLLTRQ